MFKLVGVGRDFVWLGSVDRIAELAVELNLHVVAAEDVNELKDVRLDTLSVFYGGMLRGKRRKHRTVQPLHLDRLDWAIDAFELLLTKSLRVQKASNFFSK